MNNIWCWKRSEWKVKSKLKKGRQVEFRFCSAIRQCWRDAWIVDEKRWPLDERSVTCRRFSGGSTSALLWWWRCARRTQPVNDAVWPKQDTSGTPGHAPRNIRPPRRPISRLASLRLDQTAKRSTVTFVNALAALWPETWPSAATPDIWPASSSVRRSARAGRREMCALLQPFSGHFLI